MNIQLPATLTALYRPDLWSEKDYETNGSGEIGIQFGGFDVATYRIEADGNQFESDGSYSRSEEDANESISAFVAEKLKGLFK